MSVTSQGQPAKKPPHKFALGLIAFWTLVAALAPNHPPGTHWWHFPFFGLAAAAVSILVIVLLLRMFGVGGFVAFAVFTIGAVLWKITGPIPTVFIGGAAAYLLWRYRFQIAQRFGVQVPEPAASSTDTSSAAASNQDSNSGTVN